MGAAAVPAPRRPGCICFRLQQAMCCSSTRALHTRLHLRHALAHSSLPCAVCKRLKSLAEAAVHSYQQRGQSVMDAVELAQPGDTVHLLPQRFKEALLLRKPLHLTCDGGRASILSPARFAIMVTAGGCLLENLVIKSHQVGRQGLRIAVRLACFAVAVLPCMSAAGRRASPALSPPAP